MTFEVTYRGVDGAVHKEHMEAAGRGECLAQYRARGIAPISVKEGKPILRRAARESRRDGRDPKGKANGKTVAWTVAVVIVLVVTGGLWWWLCGGARVLRPADPERPKAVATKTKSLPKEVKPAPRSPKTEVTVAAPTNDVLLVSEDKDPNDPANRIKRETYEVKTNTIGKIISRYETEDGKKHMVIGYIEPKVEMSAADQLLAMATASMGGGMAPAPPVPGASISERQFRETVEKPIAIEDNDTAEVKALKERINASRAEALALLDSGVSASRIFEEHQKLALENDQIRVKCQNELNDLVKNGDTEGAHQYLTTMSAALGQMGIAPLKMPMTDAEREELNARRRAIKEEIRQRKEAEERQKQETKQ